MQDNDFQLALFIEAPPLNEDGANHNIVISPSLFSEFFCPYDSLFDVLLPNLILLISFAIRILKCRIMIFS